MPGLLGNIFKKTSSRGKTLTKIGVGIGAFGLGLEFDPFSLEQMLTDEKLIFWILVIKYASLFLGTFLTGAGAIQTDEKELENSKK